MSRRHILTVNGLTVALYGHQKPLRELGKSALAQAHNLGAHKNKVCRLQPPSGAGQPGFQTIQQPIFTGFLEADGVVLTESGCAAIMQTRDCPTVVLQNRQTGSIVVTHAGRPALTPPIDCEACGFTIMYSAVKAALLGGGEPSDLFVHITGSICGLCFTHDLPGGEECIRPFDRFDEAIFTNRQTGALDLVKLITALLTGYDIPASQITHDGLCTRETNWLASKRGGSQRTNTVIVVLTPNSA